MTDEAPKLVGEADLDHDVAGFDFSWADQSVRNLINELVGLEAVSIDNSKTGDHWNFKPHPLSRFGYLVNAVLLHTQTNYMGQPTSLLEVGCGVGTKLVMVDKVFGLDSDGFDINPEYVASARALIRQYDSAASAVVNDALLFNGYGSYDIVFHNRPIWVYDVAMALEAQVTEHMSSGAYLILGNSPSKLDWPIIATDTAMAVYQKP
jgi:SAM-dependent methyltransferase